MIPDPRKLSDRASRVGMVINVMLPAGIALLAYAIHASGMVQVWAPATASPPVLFLICGAMALSELLAAFIMKKRLFSRERVMPIRKDPAALDRWLLRSSIIVYALGASPMVYGSVLYVLSGDLGQLAFFGIVTLLAYRLFRPTADQLEELLRDKEIVLQ